MPGPVFIITSQVPGTETPRVTAEKNQGQAPAAPPSPDPCGVSVPALASCG